MVLSLFYMTDNQDKAKDKELLIKKYLYIAEQVSLLKQGTNQDFLDYIQKFDEYSDQQEKSLEQWRKNEVKFSEDEKENSLKCCNSDCEYYENQIEIRYKEYLRFRADILKKYFPQCYEYFATENPTIFENLKDVKSYFEGVSLPNYQQNTSPKLTPQEILADSQEIAKHKFQASKESIVVNEKTYRIGDIVSLKVDPDIRAHIMFTHPNVVLAIDGETVTLSQKKFSEIVC